MTCDEAFDILTSPAASSSAGLHDHLHACPRCRDLQEALAPALQTLSREEFGEVKLPWSHSEQTARAAASRLSTSPSNWRSPSTSRGWRLRYLLAFFVGAGTVAGLSTWWPGHAATVSSVPANSPVCLWQTRDTSVFEGQPDSQAVILTCIACHLDHRVSTTAALP